MLYDLHNKETRTNSEVTMSPLYREVSLYMCTCMHINTYSQVMTFQVKSASRLASTSSIAPPEVPRSRQAEPIGGGVDSLVLRHLFHKGAWV